MSALTYLFCPAPPVVVEEPQELRFSPGILPVSTLTRRQKLQEAKRKKAKAKVKPMSCTKALVAPILYKFIVRPKPWLLFHRAIPQGVAQFLYNAGNTFQEIYLEIIKLKRRQQNYFLHYNSYSTVYPPISLLNTYMEHAIKHQRLRNRLRGLVRKAIRSKLAMKNTEDLMTGDVPVSPVRLVDWSTRSIYTFEARTIARDIITRLTMSHCDFFPWPKEPRNPYTNEALTEGQFYSVTRQLRACGETHWTIEALYSAKYNIEEFERDMYSKLKRTIHNSVFANPCGDVAKRILLEYIKEEHKMNDKPYEREIYEWAVETIPYHFFLHEWRLQCSKYYSVVHFPTEKEKDDVIKEKIDEKTRRLCVYPLALVEKYNGAHEKKYVKLEDRVTEILPHITVFTIGAADLAAIMAVYAQDAQEDADASEAETEAPPAPSAGGEDSPGEAD